jgi:hypothetical protein
MTADAIELTTFQEINKVPNIFHEYAVFCLHFHLIPNTGHVS